jgi:hypothetical protein
MASQDYNDRLLSKLISIKPGVRFVSESPDRLFAITLTHGLEFTGIATVKTIRAILQRLSEPIERNKLIEDLVHSGVASYALASKTVEVLEGASCIAYLNVHCASRHQKTRDFFSALNREFEEHTVQQKVAVIAPRETLASIDNALASAFGERIQFSIDTVEDLRLAESSIFCTAVPPTLVLCWGYPYRSPICREINRRAVTSGIPTLFGACDGLTGFVGPLVQGQDFPCLNCAVQRLVSASGMEGEPVYYPEPDNDGVCMGHAVHHPVHNLYVMGAFVLESAKFVQGFPTVSIGSLWEHSFFDATSVRRPVLRTPNCGVCRPTFARRLGWNAIHPEIRISEIDNNE